MIIEVIEEDIVLGTPGHCERCMFARAWLRHRNFEFIDVSYFNDILEVIETTNDSVNIWHSETNYAGRVAERFDTGDYDSAFELIGKYEFMLVRK